MNILDKILATKIAEIKTAQAIRRFEDIYAEARAVERPVYSFADALRESSAGIISEFKRRSPSRGFIKEGAEVEMIVKGYADNGAAAISILTDRDYFGGSLDDLVAARGVTEKPLLRKDFAIDPYQLCEARLAGADAVLLIAAALTPGDCLTLARFAAELGLEVLLELHDEAEIGHINPYVDVVGVNNRDLTTFVTDIAVSKRMAQFLPQDRVMISESGISAPETVRELKGYGFRGFLMGENFMKEPDPAQALGRFIQAVES